MPATNTNSSENTSSKTNIKLGRILDDNVFQFKKVFKDDDTFMVRFFANQQCPELRFCILYIDGMVDVQTANRTIMEPITKSTLPVNYEGDIDSIMSQVVNNNNTEKSYDPEEMITKIIQGESVLLMDNCSEALIICTKGWKSRSITEPENEKVLRGPREGFVEPILVNLSLIRRRLETPDLKFKSLTIGVKSKTKVSVCYIEGIVNPQILAELLERLNKINIEGVMGSGILVELIKDAPYSPFKTIGSTERPDIAAAKLLEGRIVVISDGSPVAFTLPFLFEEYFQSNEDYYINYYFSSISRILRIIGFMITTLAPGFYVALMAFHQEMIPTPLLMGIFIARQGIPFPTVVETFGLLLIFEILREAGIRMPTHLGQSLSILGALVLGTAAVEARIVSATVIVLVALTGMTGLMTPRIKGPAILIRFIAVICSGILGIYGFIFFIMGIVLHLCSIRSFGIPYLMSYTSLKAEDLKDLTVRVPLWFMKGRQRFISGQNKVKQKSGS